MSIKYAKPSQEGLRQKENKMKYWIESSYDFEDKNKEHNECLIVAVDYGKEGTETIATFDINQKIELKTLINHFNKEIK